MRGSAESAAASLLERNDEFARLGAALQSASDGTGALVLIEGDAGIGKTELVRSTRDRAESTGLAVASARGSELEQDLAFGLVRQLLEPFVANPEPELFVGAAELAKPLFQPAALSDSDAGPGGDQSFSVLHGLYWLCANLAQRRPLLLAVDDAHWADPASFRFLAYLGTRLEGLPVVLLIAARPHETPVAEEFLGRLHGDPLARTIEPAPLSTDAVATLIEAMMGRAPDRDFAEACRRASGGVPLLVRELIRALDHEGVEPVAASAARVEQVGPRTVARYVIARLRRLAPEAERVARSVAVLGADSELHRVVRLAGVEDEAAAVSALDSLAVAGVVSAGRPLEFVHPVVRAAVYGELQPGERSRLHAQAAELLIEKHADEERAATHLLAAAPAGRQEVVELLRRTAREAFARGAPRSAIAYLARALSEPPDPEVRGHVLHELGVAELHSGSLDDASAHLRQAYRLAEPGRQRAVRVQDLGGALRIQWKHREASAAIAEALAQLEPADADLALALRAELVLLATLEPAAYDEAEAVPEAIPGLRRDRFLGAAKYLAALTTNAVVFARRPAAEAIELAAAAREAGIVEDLAHGGSLWINAVAPLIISDGFALAEQMIAEAFEASQSQASMIYRTRAYVTRSMLRFRQGDLAEAQADAEVALATATESRFYYFALLSLSVLVEVHCERGDLDAADRALERLNLNREIPDTFIDNWVLLGRGRLRLEQGRTAEGIADLTELRRRDGRRGQRNPAVHPSGFWLAFALLREGDADGARLVVAEDLEIAKTWGARRAIGMLLRALALCEGGEEGIDLLRESVATLEGTGARLEHAHSLIELGAAIRRAGHRAEAREPLREGIELAHHCGAAVLVEQAREELLATGARPRRILRTGVDALTPSELRVARMAAEGLTNREIAQALFVTARTVEGHLTHAFQKLDIASRGELGPRLAVEDGG